jgi:hypothetical protein
MDYFYFDGLFYCSEINGDNIPPDAVPITEEEHAALFDGQSNGQRIVPGPGGKPVLEDNPPPSTAEILKSVTNSLQAHLDATARAAGYDSITSAISYADEPAVPKFQQEGQAFRAWRSLYWAAANQIKAQVEAGTRPIPPVADLIAELPTLTLP